MAKLPAFLRALCVSLSVFLNNADLGIRFDYPAYRKDHMDQLTSYMLRYIVRPTQQ